LWGESETSLNKGKDGTVSQGKSKVGKKKKGTLRIDPKEKPLVRWKPLYKGQIIERRSYDSNPGWSWAKDRGKIGFSGLVPYSRQIPCAAWPNQKGG